MPIKYVDEQKKVQTDSISSKIRYIDTVDGDSTPNIEHQNVIGSLFNVPGAAITSALLGRGYTQGALNPSQVPSGSDIGQNIGSNLAGRLPPSIAKPLGAYASFSLGNVGSIIDPRNIVNPLTVLGLSAGLTPVKSVLTKAATTLSQTKYGKRILNILQKKRGVKDALGGKKAKIDVIAEDAIKAGQRVRHNFQAKYGSDIDNIANSIDDIIPLDDIAQSIDKVISQNPGISNKKELLRIADDMRNDLMTGRDMVTLKGRAQKGLSTSIKSGKTLANQEQSLRMQIAGQIDEKLLNAAPEKYAAIKSEYRDMSRAVSDVNKVFYEGFYPGGGNVMKPGFAPGYGISPRQNRSLKEVSRLAETLDPYSEFYSAFNLWRQQELVKRGVGLGIIGSGLMYGARRKVGEGTMELTGEGNSLND